MRLVFTPLGGDDYRHWQSTDKAVLKRVNRLLDEVLRDPFSGIGKPEPLPENLPGFWSRRIDDTHRLVYTVEDGDLAITACR